jgi:rhodanese-related sulfurtransferase
MNPSLFIAPPRAPHSKKFPGLSAAVLIGTLTCLLACSPANESAVRSVSPDEITQGLSIGRNPLILDVRSAEEFKTGHVPGAILVPVDELPDRLDILREIKKEREVVVYCESGKRARNAAQILIDSDFEAVGHLEGDMAAWREKGLPIER